MSRQLCGGTSSEKTVTPEVQQIAYSMKSEIEEKANRTYDVFVVKSFKTQIVAGINYFMKIHVGGDDYIHVKIYEDLPCRNSKKEVSDIKTNKLHTDDLVYF
ncbi:cystatin-A1-like [Chiloscyllium plagiosum]|uniref:cystatin-A1-like n=1 Tax=Chiloscyllium plagiosum TaxID=36176 RepID=UPI001CB7E0F3|nr:cystatin-A1-like [Chiloscyllium plagiosum]